VGVVAVDDGPLVFACGNNKPLQGWNNGFGTFNFQWSGDEVI